LFSVPGNFIGSRMKRNLILLTILLTALSAFSAEYYVDASRPDDSGAGTSWAMAKQTIQAAVDLTIDGDTVWVTNGTYVLSAEIYITNAITLCSVNGPEVTIVDGNGATRCFNLSDACLVSGFAITNGFASGEYPYWNGGGIYCSTPFSVVSNCVISGNSIGYGNDFGRSDGGGMSGGFAVDCVFSGNTAGGGGGMCSGVASNCTFIWNLAEGSGPLFNNPGSFGGGGMSDGTAYNCTFTSNSANWSGGAMERGTAYNSTFNYNGASYGGGGLSVSTAYGCVFRGNSSYCGGGMGVGRAVNCTFINNSASYGGGIFFSDNWAEQGIAVYNCIFFGNTASGENNDISKPVAYNSCSSELTHGVNGNITNAPLFVDAANGNFRLQSNSPCINWGNNSVVSNATDLAGNPRIVEGTVDMGAYEYQGIIDLADSDADGIADDWERQHGGNQNPGGTCSNGVNTILQAYIAGLEPNDPNSKLLTSVFRSPTSGNELQWPGVSGRVYSVYFSTNLLNGFQPLATNIPWTAGAFTDTVHSAQGQGFYKIGVELK